MPTKSKTTKPSNSNTTPAVDPRLARVFALIDTFHPHTAAPNLEEQFPLVFRRLLDCVPNWGLVNGDAIKALIAAVTTPSGVEDEEGPGGVDEAKSEILDAMSNVADDEHDSICACCRRQGSDAEFRRLVVELQTSDPAAVKALLVKARKLAAGQAARS